MKGNGGPDGVASPPQAEKAEPKSAVADEIGRLGDQLIPEAGRPEPRLGEIALRQIGRCGDQT